jgi:hypothetical protein
MGGFAQHGLARCIIFGRVAARHAAKGSDVRRRPLIFPSPRSVGEGNPTLHGEVNPEGGS